MRYFIEDYDYGIPLLDDNDYTIRYFNSLKEVNDYLNELDSDSYFIVQEKTKNK